LPTALAGGQQKSKSILALAKFYLLFIWLKPQFYFIILKNGLKPNPIHELPPALAGGQQKSKSILALAKFNLLFIWLKPQFYIYHFKEWAKAQSNS